MPIQSASWAEALDPIMNHWFEIGMNLRPPMMSQLFNVQRSANSDEKVGGIGGIGVDAWDSYENTGKVQQVDFDKGYIKTYTHVEKVVELEIQRKMLADNKYPQITAAAQRLGVSAAQKRELDAASLFNSAFTGTSGPDSVSLCSNSHPLSPNKTGSTQDNYLTLALTKANVATAREQMMAFTDDAGNILGITPNLLLVPPELEDEAIEITASLLDPTSGNNTVNPMNGRFRVMAWHYLTDANAWFLIDSVMMKMALDWFDREPLQITRKVQDETLRATYVAYMRYSFGWSDFRWIIGSNPS